MLDKILECFPDEEIVKANGFDAAVIGIDESSMRLVYSVSECIQILCAEMSEEEAIEFFEFNVRGSYIGDKTPIWCTDL